MHGWPLSPYSMEQVIIISNVCANTNESYYIIKNLFQRKDAKECEVSNSFHLSITKFLIVCLHHFWTTIHTVLTNL